MKAGSTFNLTGSFLLPLFQEQMGNIERAYYHQPTPLRFEQPWVKFTAT